MDNYKNTFETWNKLANAYQEKFMDLDLYNDTYDLFCNLIEKPNAKILEIGCGPGNITKYILSKRPDLFIDGIDVAPTMITLAKENNPTANFKVMDCRDIDSLSGKFDGIICGFCLPYLSKEDVAKFIKDCGSLLNEKGILYFSTIEGDYQRSNFETSSNGEHTMFVYYHEEKYLTDYLQKNNFEIAGIAKKYYAQAAGASSTHIIFTAKKK